MARGAAAGASAIARSRQQAAGAADGDGAGSRPGTPASTAPELSKQGAGSGRMGHGIAAASAAVLLSSRPLAREPSSSFHHILRNFTHILETFLEILQYLWTSENYL